MSVTGRGCEGVYWHDVRVTHKNGRKVRPFTWTNERTATRAHREYKRAVVENPGYRFALIERDWLNQERDITP